MKQETVLSLVLEAACIISVTQAEWKQAARDHILKVHNDYRRNEGGCQMNELLVWDKTEKVGCYSYRCPSLKYGSSNAWYLVCFYTPGGNMVGQEPYQTQCDAPCRNGQTLVNGLCQGQAIIPCVDVEAHCDHWKGMDYCTGEYAPFMAENCRKTCSLC
ncbi:cysteine-rich secretory protein lccl domain-containing 2 [Plakobranchus ocellatus]|uniref:Cysteine-rich secretory protein lccl domain-containing 2 n=1 Tax=Plakobranchus ocellatus TaxID=259542 RepID=A0AAV4D706_9GAST|nr:cysteine-rich secretory protein lccl domain-containing 2 [Plakobranchus ocellatus]